jgi:hypothetical protein
VDVVDMGFKLILNPFLKSLVPLSSAVLTGDRWFSIGLWMMSRPYSMERLNPMHGFADNGDYKYANFELEIAGVLTLPFPLLVCPWMPLGMVTLSPYLLWLLIDALNSNCYCCKASYFLLMIYPTSVR